MMTNTNTTQLLEVVTNKVKHSSNEYSPLALAYIGDGVYEMFIRTYVLNKGNMPVNKMHKASRSFVCAEAQAQLYYILEPILTEEELAVLKRGRNAKSISSPKNASIAEYRRATGLEALIGYLYLDHQIERIEYLMELGLKQLVETLEGGQKCQKEHKNLLKDR